MMNVQTMPSAARWQPVPSQSALKLESDERWSDFNEVLSLLKFDGHIHQQNPGTLFVWGMLITLLIGLSMLPFFLGLLVVGPVIGHATWHAYRAIVPPTDAAVP